MIPHITEEKKFTMPVTVTEFDLPQDIKNVDIFLKVFDKVEEIANSPNSVTTAVSSNERMRAIQSTKQLSDQPCIVAPYPRNKYLLKCKCKTSVWRLTCEHALGPALNLQNMLKEKKIQSSN